MKFLTWQKDHQQIRKVLAKSDDEKSVQIILTEIIYRLRSQVQLLTRIVNKQKLLKILNNNLTVNVEGINDDI